MQTVTREATLAPSNSAPSQEPLDCAHSRAHDFGKERADANRCETTKRTVRARADCISALRSMAARHRGGGGGGAGPGKRGGGGGGAGPGKGGGGRAGHHSPPQLIHQIVTVATCPRAVSGSRRGGKGWPKGLGQATLPPPPPIGLGLHRDAMHRDHGDRASTGGRSTGGRAGRWGVRSNSPPTPKARDCR